MADPRTAAVAGRFEIRATASDHFAWVRTRLALELCWRASRSVGECADMRCPQPTNWESTRDQQRGA